METYRRCVTTNEDFMVNDIIAFDLKDGEHCEAIVAAVDGKNALCIFRDCVGKEFHMNTENTNEGGWEKTSMREYLNTELIKELPDDLVARLQQDDNGDYLRLLKDDEIFGDNKYSIFEDERNIRALEHYGSDCFNWYWTQTPHGSAYFGLVNLVGSLYGGIGASDVLGVRPAFLISQSNNPMSEDIESETQEPESHDISKHNKIHITISGDGFTVIDVDN